MENYQLTSPNGVVSNAFFMGRWVPRKIGKQLVMYTTNLGAQIIFRISNASSFKINFIIPNLLIPQILTVKIDDKSNLIPLKSNSIEFKLTSKKDHYVRLYFTGNTDLDSVWIKQEGLSIRSITANPSAKIQAVKPLGKSVVFIGDSITAGCWLRSKSPSFGYGADINYAALLAEKLNWEDYRIAYSAAGLLRPGTGGVPPAPVFIKQINQNIPAPHFKADLILINLGTNDRNYPSNVFKQQLIKFINEVKMIFQTDQIVLITPLIQAHSLVIKNIAKELHVNLISTDGWSIKTIDGIHPNPEGSKIMSEKIAQYLIKKGIA